jgi:hypothetical protein
MKSHSIVDVKSYPTDPTGKCQPAQPTGKPNFISRGWSMAIPQCPDSNPSCAGQQKHELALFKFVKDGFIPIVYVDSDNWQNYQVRHKYDGEIRFLCFPLPSILMFSLLFAFFLSFSERYVSH